MSDVLIKGKDGYVGSNFCYGRSDVWHGAEDF